MLKILAVGAHPDDCDILAGGSAALWRKRGDVVRFISLTNGNAGHFSLQPLQLAERRRAESTRAATVIGIEYDVLDNDDGRLEPTLARRLDLIRRIREFRPDLILTHRPNDYHPDHRYASILVQDSAYLVEVPGICPEAPRLEKNPVIAYFSDDFKKPCPFSADVVVDVDPVMGKKWDMLHSHASQFYEWLPYVEGQALSVPTPEAARREWLEKTWGPRLETVAQKHLECLSRLYGNDHASDVEYAEAFELSEYGSRASPEELSALFPVPGAGQAQGPAR